MARYIDADELINEISAACMPIYEKGITGILGDNSSIADIINEQPTADVQPVAHAEWIGFTRSAFLCCDHTGEPIYRDTTVWKCSHCSRNTVVRDNYCPNCGARMDGDSE